MEVYKEHIPPMIGDNPAQGTYNLMWTMALSEMTEWTGMWKMPTRLN